MDVVLAFARTNETILAESVLQEAGLAVRVMPLPPAIRAGCGVCLRLPQPQAQKALALLEQAEIPVQDIYTKTTTGEMSAYSPYTGGEHD